MKKNMQKLVISLIIALYCPIIVIPDLCALQDVLTATMSSAMKTMCSH